MSKNNKPISAKNAVKYYGMSKKNLEKIGVTSSDTEKYNTIAEVLESDEGMAVAQVRQTVSMKNNSCSQTLKAGEVLVMPMGQFVQGKKKKIYKPYRKSFKEMFRRYKGQNLDGKTLLVWRTGGLGDVIITQSTVRAIKERYPTCKVIYATQPAFHETFYAWPKGLVDEVIPVPFKKEYLEKCDYHLTFIHSIENCLETNSMNYFEIFQKMTGIDYDYKNYISTLSTLPNVIKSLQQVFPPNLIILHIKSSTKLRDMSMNRWTEIIRLLLLQGYRVGIIDRKGTEKEIDYYIKQIGMNDNPQVLNLAKFSLDLNFAIGMGSMAKGAICIDSGYAHIMGALRKPAVVICGPYQAKNVCSAYTTIEGIDPTEGWNECNKYPCYFNNQENQCPYVLAGMTPGCIDSISAKRIVDKLNEVIKNNENSRSTNSDN